MKSISHRELRNQSAQVLREVAAGETYTITNHGTDVARLSPPSAEVDLPVVRRATARPVYATRARVRSDQPTGELLDDLRDDR